jgi:predicted nucleic-acid-binding protein
MTSCWVDTNVLLRFITCDPPDMAIKALSLFKRAEKGEVKLRMSSMVIAETVWTLSSYYRYSKQQICDVLVPLLNADGVDAEHEDLVVSTLMQMAKQNVDFTDAYLAATARHYGEPVSSFDND